ncbi:protein of unknown function [Tepidibacter aestuarii]|nr:protein of unknown function [Tepidibacter aestuarii]
MLKNKFEVNEIPYLQNKNKVLMFYIKHQYLIINIMHLIFEIN